MSDDVRAGRERATREAAGHLVVALAEELARPLGEVRDLLATVVGTLDTYAATAKGPLPLSYDASKEVRELIAEAFLKAADAARLARELSSAVVAGGAVETGSLNDLVEAALVLAKCQFSAATELFIDLGTVGPVAVVTGEAVMGIARVLVFCAESTAGAEQAAISIRTRAETRDRPEVVLSISENGRGGSDIEIANACGVLDGLATRLGGQLTATSEPGSGSSFELRLPMGG